MPIPPLRFIVSALVCSFLLVGCAAHQRARKDPTAAAQIRTLRWLESANAERDVAAAVKRRDFRFIGIYGYVPYTPAIAPEIAERYGVRYLQGTSNSLHGPGGGRLQRLAVSYAKQYNTFMLQRLHPQLVF